MNGDIVQLRQMDWIAITRVSSSGSSGLAKINADTGRL